MKILEKTLFAGFGGQGILSTGRIFADTCVEKGLNVSWLPSYGPEMRGGTCNCLVAVSNKPVLSPYFVRPTNAIIMNQASMDRFLPTLNTAKVVVVNTSLVDVTQEIKQRLSGVRLIEVDATNIAISIGAPKSANMVMLGAYAASSGALSLDDLKKSVEKKFSKNPETVEKNMTALNKGYAAA